MLVSNSVLSKGGVEKNMSNSSFNHELSAEAKINYLLLLERLIYCFESNNFIFEDKILGNSKSIVHKTNDYNKDQLVYSNIPNFSDLQVNLIKNREEKSWTVLKLLRKNTFFTKFNPNFEDFIFENKLKLKFKEIKFDEKLKYYKYVYSYKNNFDVVFIVDEGEFNSEKYPNNFKAFEIRK